jgi:hypothetical protein
MFLLFQGPVVIKPFLEMTGPEKVVFAISIVLLVIPI